MKKIMLKSLSIKFVILLLLVLGFGCSSISELRRDGIGQPISTIIDSMGAPSRVIPDGSGGKIYIWERWVATDYGGGHLWSNTYCADSNGIIYAWR
jgi:hypothetical protein